MFLFILFIQLICGVILDAVIFFVMYKSDVFLRWWPYSAVILAAFFALGGFIGFPVAKKFLKK